MTWIVKILALYAFFALLLGSSSVWAYGTQVLDNPWTLCAKLTQKQEREKRIPHRLLKAISLAESGRWHPDTGEISAWPWTVMAKGKGRFFDTKQQALDWVRKLQADGVTNIDVGCMQINLYHHGFQFPSLEHALDPEHNTAYAAKFLREKFKATRSWAVAAGHYHSTNPEKNTPYKRKVFKFWHGPSRSQNLFAAATKKKSAPTRGGNALIKHHNLKLKLTRAALKKDKQRFTVNHELMSKLNKRFRKNIAGITSQRTLPTPHTQKRAQPANFKGNRTIKKIIRRNGNGYIRSFTRKRQAQLERWRQTKTWRARNADG